MIKNVLSLILLSCLLLCSVGTAKESKYLDVVREFADNVLKYGRDTYGPKKTPLFVDGLNIHTHEPVKWKRKGEVWYLSNLASQQNLFRTLDGLSRVTGNPKYRKAAEEAIRYAFENLKNSNGLLHWGGHVAYDAQADDICMEGYVHELKRHYPYYELMWEIDREATRQFIEAFWTAHILNWSDLDMNRHGDMRASRSSPWEHEYRPQPVFFESRGLSFLSTGSDLFYSGATLYKLSGNEKPLIWSKRLSQRYVETRNAKTGIGGNQYTRRILDGAERQFGDDFQEHLVLEGTFFGPTFFALKSSQICQFLLADMLGEDGKEFARWAAEEVRAWGKVAYRKKDNSFIPMLTDGTSLEGYVFRRNGYFGPKGKALSPYWAGSLLFRIYVLAYRATGDAFMWEMIQSIAAGNKFGDIGATHNDEPELNFSTTLSDPYFLLGFLELYHATGNRSFLKMAEKLGDNILATRFNKGFFTWGKKRIYSKFDMVDPLVLLHLDSALQTKVLHIPRVWPTSSFFHCPYDGMGRTYDNVIYGLTEEGQLKLAFFEATDSGNTEQLESLLAKGADVNARNAMNQTALHLAVQGGKKDVVEALISKDADVNTKDKDGKTPLHLTAQRGHKEMVELLISKDADVNGRDGDGMTLLHLAAQRGHKDVVDLLINKGADINAKNDSGETPLDVGGYRTEIAQLLMSAGARTSSIHRAALWGFQSEVRRFLDKGVNVNAKNEDGMAPLHLAAQAGRIDVMELLISKGADVNACNPKGQTSLHLVLWPREQKTVKEAIDLLLSKGAGLNAKDNSGSTVLDDVAFAFGGSELAICFEFFLSKGADANNIHFAAFQGNVDRIKSFLKEGVDINEKRTTKERTPLDYAVKGGKVEVVKLLISEGAEVNTGAKGIPALIYAVRSGDTEIAEFLLDNGADPNAVSGRGGMTALHMAVVRRNKEMVQLLIENGADVNAKGLGGMTALDVAKIVKNTEMIDLLKKHGAKE